jgi:hypothetical protein
MSRLHGGRVFVLLLMTVACAVGKAQNRYGASTVIGATPNNPGVPPMRCLILIDKQWKEMPTSACVTPHFAISIKKDGQDYQRMNIPRGWNCGIESSESREAVVCTKDEPKK